MYTDMGRMLGFVVAISLILLRYYSLSLIPSGEDNKKEVAMKKNINFPYSSIYQLHIRNIMGYWSRKRCCTPIDLSTFIPLYQLQRFKLKSVYA